MSQLPLRDALLEWLQLPDRSDLSWVDCTADRDPTPLRHRQEPKVPQLRHSPLMAQLPPPLQEAVVEAASLNHLPLVEALPLLLERVAWPIEARGRFFSPQAPFEPLLRILLRSLGFDRELHNGSLEEMRWLLSRYPQWHKERGTYNAAMSLLRPVSDDQDDDLSLDLDSGQDDVELPQPDDEKLSGEILSCEILTCQPLSWWQRRVVEEEPDFSGVITTTGHIHFQRKDHQPTIWARLLEPLDWPIVLGADGRIKNRQILRLAPVHTSLRIILMESP